MNTKYILVGLLIIAVVLFIIKMNIDTTATTLPVPDAATSTPPVIEAPEVSEGATETAPLIGTKWVWQETKLQSGDTIEAPTDVFVLRINADGTVTGTTDCNKIRGNYIQEGEVISFAPFAATRMFCPDSQERSYTEQLGLASSYVINGNQLQINLNRDYGVMTFTAEK